MSEDIGALSQIAGALSAVKSAMGLAKSISDGMSHTSVHEVRIDLQEKILTIQTSLSNLQDSYKALIEVKEGIDRELQKCRDWEETKRQYEAVQIREGIFVFRAKPDFKASNPPYDLCPQCFELREKRAPLQRPESGKTTYSCHECGFKYNPREWKPSQGIGGIGGIGWPPMPNVN